MLSIKDALKLYLLLKGHLPKEKNLSDVKFMHHITKSMLESHQEKNYAHAIMLMSNKSLDDLAEMSPQETLSLFVDGLVENRVLELAGFCKSLGM